MRLYSLFIIIIRLSMYAHTHIVFVVMREREIKYIIYTYHTYKFNYKAYVTLDTTIIRRRRIKNCG